MMHRRIATQGLGGYGSLSIASQGFLPLRARSTDTGGGARRRLDAAMDALERFLDKRRVGSELPPRAALEVLASFRSGQEATQRVAGALAAARAGGVMDEAGATALRAILAAARARVATEAMARADAELARKARNRWRAIVLAVLLLLS